MMPKPEPITFTLDGHQIEADLGMVAVMAALHKGGASFAICLADGTLCTTEATCAAGDKSPADRMFNMGNRGVRRRCMCDADRAIPNDQLQAAFEKMRAAWAA